MLKVVDKGVFVLKGFLNEQEQLMCYDECVKLYKCQKEMYAVHGSIECLLKKSTQGRHLLCFEPDMKKIPLFWNKLGQKVMDHLYKKIMKHKYAKYIMNTLPRPLPHSSVIIDDSELNSNNENNNKIKKILDKTNTNKWITDRLNCVLYPLTSKLGRHCDGMDGYVILFSFGCTAKFYLESLNNSNKKGIQVNMESGDVILYDGGENAKIYHGVDSIVKNTSPLHFNKLLPNGRIGLQLRQFIGITTHIESGDVTLNSDEKSNDD